MRGDWLAAPWEKPFPSGGDAFYPATGEFNDPSERDFWNMSRYRRLMREAWDEYFPERPLP